MPLSDDVDFLKLARGEDAFAYYHLHEGRLWSRRHDRLAICHIGTHELPGSYTIPAAELEKVVRIFKEPRFTVTSGKLIARQGTSRIQLDALDLASEPPTLPSGIEIKAGDIWPRHAAALAAMVDPDAPHAWRAGLLCWPDKTVAVGPGGTFIAVSKEAIPGDRAMVMPGAPLADFLKGDENPTTIMSTEKDLVLSWPRRAAVFNSFADKPPEAVLKKLADLTPPSTKLTDGWKQACSEALSVTQSSIEVENSRVFSVAKGLDYESTTDVEWPWTGPVTLSKEVAKLLIEEAQEIGRVDSGVLSWRGSRFYGLAGLSVRGA